MAVKHAESYNFPTLREKKVWVNCRPPEECMCKGISPLYQSFLTREDVFCLYPSWKQNQMDMKVQEGYLSPLGEVNFKSFEFPCDFPISFRKKLGKGKFDCLTGKVQGKYVLGDLIVETFPGRISPWVSLVTRAISPLSSTHTEIWDYREIFNLPKLHPTLCSDNQYTIIAIKKKAGNNHANTPVIRKIVFYCTLESKNVHWKYK